MKRLLLATAAFVAASSAFAVGPMVTQSADILDRGNCDVEGQWGRDNAKLGAAKFHVTHLGLRADCGVIGTASPCASSIRLRPAASSPAR